MLIYNFQKEFVGIDEADLKALGYETLTELRAEAADFADLFVKTPGHIHNFKHVHWIDFIDCADSTTPTKAIIHAKEKNYRCLLSVKPIYLTDYPASKAYTVYLDKLMELGASEIESIADDLSNVSITEKIEPVTTPSQPPLQATPQEKPEPQEAITLETTPYIKNEPEAIEDEPLDIVFDIQDEVQEDIEELQPEHEAISIQEPQDALPQYTYDPQVASAELGLPVDLIEEFVEDFITQAKEFKDELYKALSEHDLDNIKSLSHKLKGVAANLHIDDAFEALAVINITDKFDEISSKLDLFYRIIKKLANEEPLLPETSFEEIPVSAKTDQIQESMIADEDIYTNLLLDEIPQEENPTIEYNPQEVADDIGLDAEIFNELLSDYITESISATQKIKNHILTGDIQKWKAEAMQLKRMSQNMRIDSVVATLDELISTDDSFQAEDTLKNLDTLITQISILKA